MCVEGVLRSHQQTYPSSFIQNYFPQHIQLELNYQQIFYSGTLTLYILKFSLQSYFFIYLSPNLGEFVDIIRIYPYDLKTYLMTKGDILNSKNKNISMLNGTVANKGIAFGTISFLKRAKTCLEDFCFRY